MVTKNGYNNGGQMAYMVKNAYEWICHGYSCPVTGHDATGALRDLHGASDDDNRDGGWRETQMVKPSRGSEAADSKIFFWIFFLEIMANFFCFHQGFTFVFSWFLVGILREKNLEMIWTSSGECPTWDPPICCKLSSFSPYDSWLPNFQTQPDILLLT